MHSRLCCRAWPKSGKVAASSTRAFKVFAKRTRQTFKGRRPPIRAGRVSGKSFLVAGTGVGSFVFAFLNSFWMAFRSTAEECLEGPPSSASKKKNFSKSPPRYYRRNFHFQTDGISPKRSAELYGIGGVALRRGGRCDETLDYPRVEASFRDFGWKGPSFSRNRCGNRRATGFVHLAFPKAKIVATDLSDPYLKEAQKKLKRMNRIDFMQADGTSLPFQAEHFDAIYSVFLYFMSYPWRPAQEIIAESKRVLKPGGIFAFVDSLQTGDRKKLDRDFGRLSKAVSRAFLPKLYRSSDGAALATGRGTFRGPHAYWICLQSLFGVKVAASH